MAAWLLALALAGASTAGKAPSGLAYSTASSHVVQRQPARGSCHAIGAGLYSRPDPRCTPGTVNPAVTQSTLGSTVCRSGWTSTVRPSVSITEPEKLASMAAYGLRGSASAYEYDHLVPLELGGAVNDPRNLWPEPDYATRSGFYRNPKDRLENALRGMVCRGTMTLAQAQRLIASDWTGAYRQLPIATGKRAGFRAPLLGWCQAGATALAPRIAWHRQTPNKHGQVPRCHSVGTLGVWHRGTVALHAST
jgi:hypothetical protein